MSTDAPNDGFASFASLFQVAPEVCAEAPGRVNLLGEHTDYNGGYVLPTAIPQTTRVELARHAGETVWLATEEPLEPTRGEYTLGHEARTHRWIDYAQGVTWALRRDGHTVPPFCARVCSTVPVGAGLSSSAALLVALLRALRERYELRLDDRAVAHLAWVAEHDFVGAPVGVMDPFASSLADAQTALFLDARTLHAERVALPSGHRFVVIESGVEHQHVHGDYRTRRAECDRAAALLGVRQLRDLRPGCEDTLARLPAPLDRRARHVYSENARVLAAVDALRHGDLPRFGSLMDASHRSMRDDFEVSVSAVDALVESTRAQEGVLGARLTGGGFGGAIVALVRDDAVRAVCAAVLREAKRDKRSGVRVVVPPANELEQGP